MNEIINFSLINTKRLRGIYQKFCYKQLCPLLLIVKLIKVERGHHQKEATQILKVHVFIFRIAV